MADELTDIELDEMDPDDEVGGDAGAHPEFEFPTILVGPATAGQLNSIEEWIRPIACWRLDDTRFEFDSSFVKPGAARELKILAEVRDDNPGATLSIFGQADPSGLDEYNKGLSGRRARAIYGMLIRDAEIWEKLFQKDPKVSGDKWGEESLATMLATVGRDPAEANGGMTPDSRKELYLQYMEKLCGPKLKLDPAKDFLARNADTENHRGDVQGCGEFNAILRFSKKEDAEFNQPKNKAKRNSENAPNRRVVAYLFDPALVIDPDEWPCPASTQGTAKCRKRLFVDHEKRRAPQENRREFAKDRNTFECRFYHRLALESPCEESVLTSLQKVRVRLRLLYRDPMGQERVFPKGYRVTAICPDGASRVAKVGDDGRVRLLIDRPRQSFTLDFTNSDDVYFATAAPGSSATPADKLVLESDLEAALKEGFRVFKVPHEWSLRNSDWPTVDSPLFDRTKSEFSGFEAEGVNIGTRENPVKMVLDPHWQYLRFFYFDRFAKTQAVCLPLMMEGFEQADRSRQPPDTRSNWTTDKNGNQALPWIRRDRNRPDKDVLVQWNFKEKRTFIETKPDKSRRIVTVDEGGGPDTVKPDLVDKPGIERLRFYDLPTIWKSRGYFARPDAKSGDVFEKMADKPTSDAQPLMFSLDDVVLCEALEPKVFIDSALMKIEWDPDKDRVAIFSHLFATGPDLSPLGIFRPDGKAPYLSQKPALIKDRNYLADYPDWTRLVIMKGSLFDVFDARTPDDEKDKEVVGARAGVRYFDALKPFAGGSIPPGVTMQPLPDPLPPPERSKCFVVQGYYQQVHPDFVQPTLTNPEAIFPTSVGRFDMAVLRCCDVRNGVEIAINMHYFRFFFNFSPPPDIEFPSTPFQPPLTAAEQESYVNNTVQGIPQRWNGPDGKFNPGPALLLPAGSSLKLEVRVLWFVQAFPQPLVFTNAVPLPDEAHFNLSIFETVRAHMSSSGHGALERADQRPVGGVFVAAHETGHANSLEDEYLEPNTDCSYHAQGFGDSIPGSPYAAHSPAMMNGNLVVQPRHYWHAASWLNSIYNTDFAVKHSGFLFHLPFLSGRPQDKPEQFPVARTHVTWPLAQALFARSGERGRYDLFLYRLGDEPYGQTFLPKGPFQGYLVIVVRMRISFFHDDFDRLRDQTAAIQKAIQERFNGKFFAAGDAKGEHFTKCRMAFSPRFLGQTFTDDEKYLLACKAKNKKEYEANVEGIAKRKTPHFIVRIADDGPTGWTATGGLQFNINKNNLEDDFPEFFGNMVGVADGASKAPGSYLPLVQKVIPNGVVSPLV